MKFVSPPYEAVIECEATLSVEVENVAVCTPPTVASVPVPNVVAPSLNVTVPVGEPEAGAVALTVAVKVMEAPENDGLAEETTVVVELALLTVCVKFADVLVL